jgi:CRISPR system Cascade subunit CasB
MIPMSDAKVVKQSGKESIFIDQVFDRCRNDKGLAARLRRADRFDNPGVAAQAWEFLVWARVDLEKEGEYLSFATIAAAIARSKVEANGKLSLGQALARCYEKGSENDSAKARLRRLLACESLEELCHILRQLFPLIFARVAQSLDYVELLKQLRKFTYGPEAIRQVKAAWAQKFYRSAEVDSHLAEGDDA